MTLFDEQLKKLKQASLKDAVHKHTNWIPHCQLETTNEDSSSAFMAILMEEVSRSLCLLLTLEMCRTRISLTSSKATNRIMSIKGKSYSTLGWSSVSLTKQHRSLPTSKTCPILYWWENWSLPSSKHPKPNSSSNCIIALTYWCLRIGWWSIEQQFLENSTLLSAVSSQTTLSQRFPIFSAYQNGTLLPRLLMI